MQEELFDRLWSAQDALRALRRRKVVAALGAFSVLVVLVGLQLVAEPFKQYEFSYIAHLSGQGESAEADILEPFLDAETARDFGVVAVQLLAELGPRGEGARRGLARALQVEQTDLDLRAALMQVMLENAYNAFDTDEAVVARARVGRVWAFLHDGKGRVRLKVALPLRADDAERLAEVLGRALDEALRRHSARFDEEEKIHRAWSVELAEASLGVARHRFQAIQPSYDVALRDLRTELARLVDLTPLHKAVLAAWSGPTLTGSPEQLLVSYRLLDAGWLLGGVPAAAAREQMGTAAAASFRFAAQYALPSRVLTIERELVEELKARPLPKFRFSGLVADATTQRLGRLRASEEGAGWPISLFGLALSLLAAGSSGTLLAFAAAVRPSSLRGTTILAVAGIVGAVLAVLATRALPEMPARSHRFYFRAVGGDLRGIDWEQPELLRWLEARIAPSEGGELPVAPPDAVKTLKAEPPIEPPSLLSVRRIGARILQVEVPASLGGPEPAAASLGRALFDMTRARFIEERQLVWTERDALRANIAHELNAVAPTAAGDPLGAYAMCTFDITVAAEPLRDVLALVSAETRFSGASPNVPRLFGIESQWINVEPESPAFLARHLIEATQAGRSAAAVISAAVAAGSVEGSLLSRALALLRRFSGHTEELLLSHATVLPRIRQITAFAEQVNTKPSLAQLPVVTPRLLASQVVPARPIFDAHIAAFLGACLSMSIVLAINFGRQRRVHR